MTNTNTTRDDLRAKIFSSENSVCKRTSVQLNGVELEIKQPTVAEVMKLNEIEGTQSRVAHMLVTYAFVPGTDERVFDMGDIDQLSNMPYTPEMTEIQNVITKMLVGDVATAEKK